MSHNYEESRNKMVEDQLIKRSIKSPAVLNAMRKVARHLFVPPEMQSHAYEDCPLPIGLKQTISQPYIVAFMTEQLRPVVGMKILEIGTGSGYQAAVLAELGCNVFTMELIKEHADKAKEIFAELNLAINVMHGDGYSGWQKEAPFDAVIVTAAAESIPDILISQLKEGGRMIIPVGPAGSVQYLKLIIKNANANKGCYTEEDLLAVRFVPMVEGEDQGSTVKLV